ncbi:MAG: N-acetylmuramoyl-L-alanine amidase [Thermoleophilia bacterium]
MKPFLVALVASLVAPSAGLGAGVAVSSRDAYAPAARLSTATHFDVVGVHWQGSGSVRLRTRSVSGRWSRWIDAMPEAEDQPDSGTLEGRATRGWRLGNPIWAGESNAIQYRTSGQVSRTRAFFVSSPVSKVPLRRIALTAQPAIIPRASWGADESVPIRREGAVFATTLSAAIVHHTASTNSYTAAQSAALMRGFQAYHVKSNGWADIGYNFLVDRYGQVFEGRYGGIDRNVVGAHAQGFNTGSVGVAVIGTFESSGITPAARAALVSLLAWRLDIAHVDPLSTLNFVSGGNPRFASGMSVPLRAVSGHRDTGFTSCPGTILYGALPAIARDTAAFGGPKIYAPVVRGAVGAPVRFTARLSTVLPWTATVTDSLGAVIATGAGSGTAVDFTWDATLAAPGAYAWRIDAGATVRPATGTLGGGTAAALALQQVTASRLTFSPNGDGKDEETRISYTLTRQATVTASLTLPDGTLVASLFTDTKPAGRSSFVFRGQGMADGEYRIVLTATAGAKVVTATLSIVVNRTLAGFGASPSSFSPNADGRLDTVAFPFSLAYPVQAELRILSGTAVLATPFSGPLPVGAQKLGWDGMTATGGRAPDGAYKAELKVTDALGPVTQTVPVRVDATAPRLRALSLARLQFTLNESARVTFTINGRRIVRQSKPGTFHVVFSGTPRRVTAVALDAAGNRSRTISLP